MYTVPTHTPISCKTEKEAGKELSNMHPAAQHRWRVIFRQQHLHKHAVEETVQEIPNRER